jgi:hypothetical protein
MYKPNYATDFRHQMIKRCDSIPSIVSCSLKYTCSEVGSTGTQKLQNKGAKGTVRTAQNDIMG